MANFIRRISAATDDINSFWDKTKQQISEQLGIQDPLKILPYRGYGTSKWLYLKGRVLQKENIKTLPKDAPVWQNMRNMYRRFESDEIPNAQVRITVGEHQQTVVANEEGFFEAEIRPASPMETSELWNSVELELLAPPARRQAPVTATGQVITVSPTAKFGVISDIDDTVVYTAATDLGKMIRIAYLGNAHSRRPFAGVEPFYRALQKGQSKREGNPIFYVSSSPWNMYDLFDKFMSINDIPDGPILLRDIELSLANLTSFSHEGHKREQIEPIFKRFPDLSFILIGDSGQKDAEIYQQLATDYPDRILAIYLRDALPDDSSRRKDVKDIAETVRASGVEFVLFTQTATAAKHAAAQGWIGEDAIAKTIPDNLL